MIGPQGPARKTYTIRPRSRARPEQRPKCGWSLDPIGAWYTCLAEAAGRERSHPDSPATRARVARRTADPPGISAESEDASNAAVRRFSRPGGYLVSLAEAEG